MKSKVSRYLATMGMAVALTAALAFPAAAITFTFEQIGGFTDGSESPGNRIEFFNVVTGAPTGDQYSIIGWGGTSTHTTTANAGGGNTGSPWTNVNRSALAVETNATPNATNTSPFTNSMPLSVDSGAGPVVISRLFHKNEEITGLSLTAVTIDTRLRIFAPDTSQVLEDFGSEAIGFVETPNNGNCVAANNPLGSNCDDRFTFDVSDFAPVQFSFNGHLYEVVFGLVVPSGNTDCSTANGQGSCVDFNNGVAYTAESSTNRLDVTMAINDITPPPPGVPAPPALLILGLGLVSAAARARFGKRSGR